MKNIEKRKDGTIRVHTSFPDKTRTQQQFADDVNINKIMAKYKKTRQINHLNTRTGVYADITNIGSYEEAMQTIINAESAFIDLPSQVRARFGNNPQQLINFLSDNSNDAEAIKLGLKIQPQQPEQQSEQTTKPQQSQKESKQPKSSET